MHDGCGNFNLDTDRSYDGDRYDARTAGFAELGGKKGVVPPPTETTAAEEGPRALLRSNPAFVRLWIAQLVSFAGDWINSVAVLGLLLERTGSAAQVSLLIVAQMLPMFVTMPLAGVLADRFDRRAIMIWTNLLQALLALGFLLVRQPEQIWMLYVFTVALVVCEGIFTPAAGAALPNIVSPRHLTAANALSGASWGTMVAVGSALGGIVTANLGRGAAFTVNALSFVVSALLVASVRLPFSRAEGRHERGTSIVSATLGGIGDGVRYAHRHTSALALLLLKTAWGMGGGVIALLSVIPVEVLHAGDAGIGTLYTSRGLGALIGPFVATPLTQGRARRTALVAALGVILSGGFYAAFALAPTMTWATLFVFLATMGGGAQWVLSSTLLQRNVVDHMRGRMQSLDFAGLTLTMTLSNLACARVMSANIAGPRTVGLFAAGLIVGLGALWLTWFGWLRPPDFETVDSTGEAPRAEA